jgi:hypothetical protein
MQSPIDGHSTLVIDTGKLLPCPSWSGPATCWTFHGPTSGSCVLTMWPVSSPAKHSDGDGHEIVSRLVLSIRSLRQDPGSDGRVEVRISPRLSVTAHNAVEGQEMEVGADPWSIVPGADHLSPDAAAPVTPPTQIQTATAITEATRARSGIGQVAGAHGVTSAGIDTRRVNPADPRRRAQRPASRSDRWPGDTWSRESNDGTWAGRSGTPDRRMAVAPGTPTRQLSRKGTER